MARKGIPHDMRPALDRFWDRAIRSAIGEPWQGCWRWTGPTNPDGYGVISDNGVTTTAHRFAYTAFVGPVPKGHELDHTCRHRWCVNPYHLEPVPHRVNVLRGESPSAKNARKTHCDKGHPYDDANTYRSPKGYRECRMCRQARYRASRDGPLSRTA